LGNILGDFLQTHLVTPIRGYIFFLRGVTHTTALKANQLWDFGGHQIPDQHSPSFLIFVRPMTQHVKNDGKFARPTSHSGEVAFFSKTGFSKFRLGADEKRRIMNAKRSVCMNSQCNQKPILRLVNLQLRRQRCSRLDHTFKSEDNNFCLQKRTRLLMALLITIVGLTPGVNVMI
jgi:hypothetical protein